MSPALKKCEAQVLKLSSSDRAKLAEQLIASLDEIDGKDNERLWLDEAERRYRDYKRNPTAARSAKTVLRDARLAIK